MGVQFMQSALMHWDIRTAFRDIVLNNGATKFLHIHHHGQFKQAFPKHLYNLKLLFAYRQF